MAGKPVRVKWINQTGRLAAALSATSARGRPDPALG